MFITLHLKSYLKIALEFLHTKSYHLQITELIIPLQCTPCIVLSSQTTLTGIYTAAMLVTLHIKSFHLPTLSMLVIVFL